MAAPVADLGTGVLEMFAGLEDDERLAGHGLAAAFAAAFPSLPLAGFVKCSAAAEPLPIPPALCLFVKC